jgi:uncharacterized protein (TIGR02594 family)
MKQFIFIGLSFLLASCASQNDEFYGFYEPHWKPKKVVVDAPSEETKVEETKEELEERPTIIVRAHRLNPVYQGIKFLDYTEKEDRRELKNLTGVDPVRIEWCAAFANAILEKSEIPSNKDHKYALTARAFLDWGVAVEEPEMGDIVVFPRGNQGWQGHVGFFVKEQIIDDVLYYYILGGNQKNKVSVELFRADKAIGIRRYEEPKPNTSDNTTAE